MVRKEIVILIVLSLLATPISTASHDAKWNTATATIEADGIVVRFFQMTPHYLVWIPQENNSTVVYHIAFVKIVEFHDSDNDNIVDDIEILAQAELTARDYWNVSAWNETVDGVDILAVKFEGNISVISRTKGMVEGETASVTFVNKIYLDNYTLESGYEIAGGRELKIDIIINNWPWHSDDSKLGLVLLFAIGDKEGHMEHSPQTHMHELRVRERNVRELRLNSTETDYPLAFRWDEEVKIKYGENITNENVTSSIEIGKECSKLTIVYPHFNGTLEHDPSIVALSSETSTSESNEIIGGEVVGVPIVYLLPILALLVAIPVVILIRKR